MGALEQFVDVAVAEKCFLFVLYYTSTALQMVQMLQMAVVDVEVIEMLEGVQLGKEVVDFDNDPNGESLSLTHKNPISPYPEPSSFFQNCGYRIKLFNPPPPPPIARLQCSHQLQHRDLQGEIKGCDDANRAKRPPIPPTLLPVVVAGNEESAGEKPHLITREIRQELLRDAHPEDRIDYSAQESDDSRNLPETSTIA